MSRYTKDSCDAFVEAIQENIKYAKENIQQKYDTLEFHNADEQKSFEAYYKDIISNLDDYGRKVGSYSFLSS